MAHFDLPLEELWDYAPEVREPSDFDEFWTALLDEAHVDLDVSLEPGEGAVAPRVG